MRSMGLAYPVVDDGRVYTVVDDIALTQVLLVAGRALDDIDNKSLAVALRVGVKPTWLIARFVGDGKFSVAVGPDAVFHGPVNLTITLEAAGYVSKDVPLALGVGPILPHRIDVLLHRL